MVESFFLSNVVPQVGIAFNRGIWKNLEDHVRDRGELYAITGPSDREQTGSGTLTITDTTNVCRNKIVLKPLKRESICGAKAKCEDGVTVPIALFKIIYHPRLHRANAFILPNINHRDAGKGFADPIEYLKRFQVTVQVVEKYTGLEFFRDLSLRSRRPILEQCTSFMEYWARRARPCAGPQRGAPLMRRVAPTHEVATAAVLGYRTGPAPFALSHASAPP